MYNNPLLWEHGVFLQPQHFQLGQVQANRQIARALYLLNPYLWGVKRLVINEDSLNNGILEIVSMDLVLPSGEFVQVPENANLFSRSFIDTWTTPEQAFTVYLGIAEFREQGENVLRTDEPQDAPDRYRFVAPLQGERIPDIYGNGPEADVSTMRYNFRLCFTPDEGKELWKMPLVRLVHEGVHIKLDYTFVPPCVDFHASPVLKSLIQRLRDTLVTHTKQMEEYKIFAGDLVSSENQQQGLVLFSVLAGLSRHAPEIEQMLLAPSMHPWPVFCALCRIVGELSVFSPTINFLGENVHGEALLPPYKHDDLFSCFSAGCNIISRLVESLVVGPAYTLPLEEDSRRGFLYSVLPQAACSTSYSYWLLLRTKNLQGLGKAVETMGKLSSPADMTGILGQALPGIRLRLVDQPPAGLPRRQDTLYFLIDTTSPLWRKIVEQREIAFALPQRPDDLLVQLTVVQR